MAEDKMRFGAFIAPFHAMDENPHAAMHRDFELVEWMDKLGYDEAWIGEHHSAGFETIASPEVFIAAAAERTKNIKFGTGVSSLPYHHPLMLADRINQLDHQTRGRVMFGAGPGSLPSDAFMMGIDVQKQRDMMDESLQAIIKLLNGETVTEQTDWYTLNEARLQMAPYTRPRVEIAVASQVSPTGATAAGRHGLSLLSVGSTSTGGFNALASNWAIAQQQAKESGQTVDRKNWRLVAPVHVAETREKARENVRYGLENWLKYFLEVAALPLAPTDGGDPVDAMIESGMAVIGTPDDCIAQIKRLEKQSGGFGSFLQMAHNWADFEQTKRSYELIARYVMPEFQGMNGNRQESYNWARDNHDTFMGAAMMAVGSRIKRHIDEKGEGNVSPDHAAAIKMMDSAAKD
ncbi:MAG: limonene 1,2-monooxygenase [Parvibaculaceae bacterium]|jgi:limonene 1,2-monooxygenase|nr:LLM class flavin-dependent oxidoreductase [Parvibaculaceae bacterium]